MKPARTNPARTNPCVRRIFPVGFPIGWIVLDIFSDPVQFVVISDDVFVIIALPNRPTRGFAHFIDAP